MTDTNEYKGPLSGLNVIDFGWYYAGPMVGMLLADQGANVIRIVRPDEKELPEQQYRLLNRNKKLLELDVKTEAGKTQALSLIERADVMIENFRPGVMKRLGLDYASVKEKNPGLVYLSLPGFASTDTERAHIQAWEGVIGAAACMYTDIGGVRQTLNFPPVYTSVPQCSMYGGISGAIAIMAALVAREEQKMGTVIEVPLVDAGLHGFTQEFTMNGFGPLRSTAVTDTVMPEFFKPYAFSAADSAEAQLKKLEKASDLIWAQFPWGRFLPCADGRKVFTLGVEIPMFAERFFKALGIDKQVKREGYVNCGPWVRGLDNNIGFPHGMSAERKQRLNQLITEALLTKTGEEWETILTNAGVLTAYVRTREEWLALEPLKRSGVLTQMDKEGSVLTVPGRAVDISGPGDTLINPFQREAEAITGNQANKLFGAYSGNRVQQNGSPPLKKGDLLRGVKVLDLANFLAGPIATYTLAQYGAEVIKSDATIHLPHLIKAVLEANQGKRSILANLATAPGQNILCKLVSWADVVVHNIVDDSAKRLGVDHEKLQTINPAVVSCQISAFGGTYRGGWEMRKGIETSPHVASGLVAHYGSLEAPMLHGLTASTDVTTGLGGAFAALLGIYQRRKSGYAGEGRTSLARMCNYYQLPWMIAENGNYNLDNAHGQLALGEHWWQRLYACHDGWIYVGTSESRASVLAETIIGQSNADDKALEAAFAAQNCSHWLSVLNAADIACHRVLNLNDLCSTNLRQVCNEEADEESDGTSSVLCYEDHPSGTPVIVKAPSWVQVGENHSWKRLTPAPRFGQHTKEILRELGYEENEVEELIRLKVVREYLPMLGSKKTYFYDPEKHG